MQCIEICCCLSLYPQKPQLPWTAKWTNQWLMLLFIYDSEIEPGKDDAANAVAVVCAIINLNMQNSYYVQNSTGLAVTIVDT